MCGLLQSREVHSNSSTFLLIASKSIIAPPLCGIPYFFLPYWHSLDHLLILTPSITEIFYRSCFATSLAPQMVLQRKQSPEKYLGGRTVRARGPGHLL